MTTRPRDDGSRSAGTGIIRTSTRDRAALLGICSFARDGLRTLEEYASWLVQGSEVNAIDKLLAREEAHRVIHYRLRLKQIDQALRKQNPFVDPYDMPAEEYVQLYEAMAANRQGNNSISGWNYTEYDNPAYFLYMLRRHAVTAAFSHPTEGARSPQPAGPARVRRVASRMTSSLNIDSPCSVGKSGFDRCVSVQCTQHGNRTYWSHEQAQV
jgi:hypothetical protein